VAAAHAQSSSKSTGCMHRIAQLHVQRLQTARSRDSKVASLIYGSTREI
jgi:hypothetical protein